MADPATPHRNSGSVLCRFTAQVLRGRWFMMFASFLIMAGAGATYLFGVYSKEIKSTLGYDQSTLNTLGAFKDVGASFGIPAGLIAEVTPTWFVLLLGSLMNFVGYFVIWLAVTKKIPKPKIWQMCIYICIGANSQNFANNGSLVTCVRNFPESRGMMLGLMKGFVGLSGAIFTQVYYSVYGGTDSKSMILLIGWLPALLSAIFVFSIRPMKISTHPNEIKVFYEYLVLSIALAILLMALTITQKYVKFSHGAFIGSTAAVCFVLFLPVVIAIREELITWREKKREVEKSPSIVVVDERLPESREPEIIELPPDNVANKVVEDKEAHCFVNVWKKPKLGEDYTIMQALLSWDMLILFVATFCGLGCSLTAIDNMGQIGESLRYPPQTIGTFISLLSVWNYFGRVFSGFVSESMLLKWKIPRTLMMTFSLFLPSIGDFMIAFPFPGSVYIASLLIGFSFGIQLTLLFVIISEIFGLKYYNTLFNCGQLVSPLASYILNVRIVGNLYDKEALKQLASKGMTRSMVRDLTCIGSQCYRTSFMVLGFVNIFGALVSLILVKRTWAYYKSDIYKKFRDEMKANQMEMKNEAEGGYIAK